MVFLYYNFWTHVFGSAWGCFAATAVVLLALSLQPHLLKHPILKAGKNCLASPVARPCSLLTIQTVVLAPIKNVYLWGPLKFAMSVLLLGPRTLLLALAVPPVSVVMEATFFPTLGNMGIELLGWGMLRAPRKCRELKAEYAEVLSRKDPLWCLLSH